MNVPNFNLPPGGDSTAPQQGTLSQPNVPDGNQNVANIPAWTSAYPPFDPQQPLCEYVSPHTWTPPAYPAAGAYSLPAYPGQPMTPLPPYPNYGTPTYPPVSPTFTYPSVGYNASAYAYPSPYPWAPAPSQPKRDTYLLAVAIIAFIGSCLALLAGLASTVFLLLVSVIPDPRITPDQRFASAILFLTLVFAGLIGGSFCIYHSIRALFLRKPSKSIWLPRFWTFLVSYFVILGLGFWLHTQDQSTSSPLLTGLLIYLSAILPALTILALGIRRLRFSWVEQCRAFGRLILRKEPLPASASSQQGQWPTSWRRFVFALVSGATLSVLLAIILELLLQFLLLGNQGGAVLQTLNNPNANPGPSTYGPLLILLAVVAPIVEELVKPLAVLILIGRVRSKAEAFALGLACGIGFNLIETSGYISSGYPDWIQVALERSGAGLLHGFGAAMVALGWYILTHKEERRGSSRLLLGFGCILYAMLQHAIWNGSLGLVLIPGPIGDFFQTWSWTFGTFTVDAPELVNIAETVGILIFFLYMAGRLRIKTTTQPPSIANQPANNGYALNSTYNASM